MKNKFLIGQIVWAHFDEGFLQQGTIRNVVESNNSDFLYKIRFGKNNVYWFSEGQICNNFNNLRKTLTKG